MIGFDEGSKTIAHVCHSRQVTVMRACMNPGVDQTAFGSFLGDVVNRHAMVRSEQ